VGIQPEQRRPIKSKDSLRKFAPLSPSYNWIWWSLAYLERGLEQFLVQLNADQFLEMIALGVKHRAAKGAGL
jgi:hypothetical protein